MPLTQDDRVLCPACGETMHAGFVPVSRGLSFFRNARHRGPAFAEHLPGTHAVLRPNRLPAWRCKRCELLILRYGRRLQHELERKGVVPVEDEQTLAAVEEATRATAQDGSTSTPGSPTPSSPDPRP